MKKIASLILALGFCLVAMAQNIPLKGVVLDSDNQPVIGAFVVEQGTTNGTMTGSDGGFVLSTPRGANVQVSCIGYATRIIVNNGAQDLVLVLEDDAEMLNETVVIGYGVQKKSVVTAAISSITSDDLKATAQTRVDNVLQGMTSGVTVIMSSGAPDASSQVRIRGIGTINNSNPLYIIDGVAAGGIDYLNPNDIERIEVLKDAASGAVYGARAANGVVLITTKKGTQGKTRVTYDFSYGMQNPWRKPSVLNATEYAVMMNEGQLNAGNAPMFDDPYSLGEGTDWINEIFDKNAPVVKHDVSVSGGNENIDYMMSLGYLSRKGTIGGRFGRSFYDRISYHQNVGFKLFDVSDRRDWLNKLNLRTNVSYSNISNAGISNNSEYGSPLGSAIGMSPLETVYASDADVERYKSMYPAGFPYIIRDKDGRAYTIADAGTYNEQANPIADLDRPTGKNNTNKFVAAATSELQIWQTLKLRSSVSLDLSYVDSHSYTPEFFLTSKSYSYDQISVVDGKEKLNYGSSASQSNNKYFTWQVENVLSYDRSFGKHTINAVAGNTLYRSTSSYLGASSRGLMYPYDEWKISVDNTLGQQSDGDRNGWGRWNSIPYSLMSYFGRISYNYDERYMAEATLRRDASSRFGPENKWGTFPSFSLGWNIKNEAFMQNVGWLSTLKLRASWGINGSDNIGDFTYAVYASSGNNYAFGSGAVGSEAINIGTKPSGLANPNVKWEQSIQTDLGLETGFLGNRITATVDFYNKLTSGMLQAMAVPTYAGDSAPQGNVGNMVNRGVEFDFIYRDYIGNLHYRLGFNATYNRNKLTYLGDDATYLTGASHKIGTLTRGIVGMPFPYFYGYQSDGIFQNVEEVNSYRNAEGNLIQPKAAPGDVRFVDINGDGILNDADRTYIGKGIPDWTFGINFSAEYKGFDISMLMQGMLGVQTFNVTRRTDLYYINLPKSILNRWTGEGSTNRYPRFVFDSANENYRVSDLWVEDASFLRARNIQLGYTLPASITSKAAISRLRVYAQVENAFTLTKYTGCDPEVSSGGGFSSDAGIDRGVYPQARTVSFGVNVNF
jgi:TonB-linked SusC/RagA family outer membrane protein